MTTDAGMTASEKLRTINRRLTARSSRIAAVAVSIAIVIGGGAFAAGHWSADHGSRTGSAATAANLPAKRSPSTGPRTTSRSSTPTPTSGPRLVLPVLGTHQTIPTNPASAPPTTTAPGSRLPAGTLLGVRNLTGTVVFTPTEAVSGTQMSYTATLTNPADRWVFTRNDVAEFSLYMYETDDDLTTPDIVYGPRGSAPLFQRKKGAGIETGLLLAPRASYSFSGNAYKNRVIWCPTVDYVAHADIVYTPAGVPDASGTIVRGAGSFTVLVPTPTTMPC